MRGKTMDILTHSNDGEKVILGCWDGDKTLDNFYVSTEIASDQIMILLYADGYSGFKVECEGCEERLCVPFNQFYDVYCETHDDEESEKLFRGVKTIISDAEDIDGDVVMEGSK